MRSILDELIQELAQLRNLVQSLAPVNEALATTQNPIIQQYVTIRRRFDYAAFIGSLYASFEKFCETLVVERARLSAQRTAYPDLPKSLKDKHESKSAELLHKGRLGQGRYANISPLGVVKNLFDCMSGVNPYALNEVALSAHDMNLRYSELSELFKAVGVNDLGIRVRRAQEIIDWYTSVNRLDGDAEDAVDVPLTSIETQLEDLIERRNQVAHRGGSPDDLLGAEEMEELLNFVEAFASSIYRTTAATYLTEVYKGGTGSTLLTRTEGPYRNGRVFVVEKPGKRLYIGQPAFALSSDGRAHWGRIESLHVEDSPVNEVDGGGAKSIGVGFDFASFKAPSLYALEHEDDAIWPASV